MASAAAVAANQGLSPSVVGQDHEESNGVTSTIAPKDQNDPKTVEEEEEEDDDIQSSRRRPQAAEAADGRDEGGVGDDDLFGEDEDGDGDQLPEDPIAVPRELDDRDLDSGDDEGRTDRVGDAPAEDMEEREIPMMDLEIPRQAGPTPSDGETYLLKVPSFMALDPRAWKPATFQPPSTDHHTKTPSPTFSPFNTAMTTLRWRHSPSNPSSLQSNARILRWSDGSLTVQLASDPTTQYEIAGNALAPPQRNPLKPTPTSISTSSANRTTGRRGANPSAPTPAEEKYDPSKDALTYLVQPVPSAESLRISHKLTAGLTIKQSANVIDDAIEKLQAGLAAATNATKVGGAQGAFLHEVDEDPELAKKRAEVAEREKQRMKKRAEAQMERERDRAGRVMGRHGMGGSRYGGGLSAGMLEDDEGGAMPTSRGTKKGSGPRRPRQRKANSEYSSDEDYGRKGFGGGQDEYDEEDDFLAPSDEEEEVGGDDDEDDVDDGIREEPRDGRGGSPKRGRGDEDGGEEDAAGEDDDEGVAQPGAGRKRRKVVEDDEDDE